MGYEDLHIFRRFDLDGDGKISPAELCIYSQAIGQELTVEEAAAMVESIDTDGDGLIGYEDFMALVGEEYCEEEEEEEEGREKLLKEAFFVYEMEGTGCITPTSLRRVLDRLGNYGGIEECEIMIGKFDLDGDGVLSFEEFKVMMML